MCRNIKPLFNFDPPITSEEVRAATLQFVRKISGFQKPSKANEAPFFGAVEEISSAASRLLRSPQTNAPPKKERNKSERATPSFDKIPVEGPSVMTDTGERLNVMHVCPFARSLYFYVQRLCHRGRPESLPIGTPPAESNRSSTFALPILRHLAGRDRGLKHSSTVQNFPSKRHFPLKFTMLVRTS
jgi:hypothetical protein